jgi:hypothetical protein
MELEPGERMTVGFTSGTDTFDSAAGAALQAGDRVLVVSLDVSIGTSAGRLVSPPTRLLTF